MSWTRAAKQVEPFSRPAIARLIELAGQRVSALAPRTSEPGPLWSYQTVEAPGYLDLLSEARHWEKRTGPGLVTDAQFEPLRQSPVSSLVALADQNGNSLSANARRELLRWFARDTQVGTPALGALVAAYARDPEGHRFFFTAPWMRLLSRAQPLAAARVKLG
jgi:hypothetical protein